MERDPKVTGLAYRCVGVESVEFAAHVLKVRVWWFSVATRSF